MPTKERLAKNLLAGFAVLVPIGLTFWVTMYVYKVLNGLVEPIILLLEKWTGHDLPSFAATAAVLAFMTVALFIVGRFVSTHVGRWIHQRIERLLMFIPYYNPIRDSVKLLIDSLRSKDGLFCRVVKVQTEIVKDGYVYGLVTGDCMECLENGDPSAMLSVFVVHGPVGNSGFNVTVPRKYVEVVNDLDGAPLSIAKFMTQYNLRLGYGLTKLS